MTNEEALRIYDEFFGSDAGGLDSSAADYDDEDRIDMVREIKGMLDAPTIDEAMEVIESWGRYENNRKFCEAMRAKYDADGRIKPCEPATTPAPPPPLPR